MTPDFYALWQQQDWHDVQMHSMAFKREDVEVALHKAQRSISHNSQLKLTDFQALLSPAAEPLLVELATTAQQLTRQRFGHTQQLFAPLYLSNLCANECSYCGFSMSQKVKRRVLTAAETEQECQALKNMGIDQVLVVTGEHERKVGMPYFRQMLPLIRRYFSSVMLEVQPLHQADYVELRQLGVDAVMVYQESYHQPSYQHYHLKGQKADIRWRLECPDRLGQAGVDKIGLGVLFGLANWRTDATFLAMHLLYMQQRYWRSRYSLSVPRIRPCSGGIEVQHPLQDKHFVQLICAFRLLSPSLEISLSTRERAGLRDQLVPIAITSSSAGSSTRPGGYAVDPEALEQFSIDDNRSPVQYQQRLQQLGLAPVLKDWDLYLGRET
ncbi:2-iminoacetate synthase ThiH [Alkalimonas collagenimarina]|uniref:2-iminoacetate synthase ThiH n=1 Tax=Alkalimonas collagenimarina TaxID=400390 RepID=A0ABT9H0G9_9GAMM|nr:2-iminoacetate synthase ThiH [Alkalimonas collagenimarina]MDP4536773.1 2-iminoacetate synthase ThiH [Alkalimonas collagenimarina]